MAVFNIDGLTYTDKLPHSRIERLLYQILKKQEGGDVKPESIGYGLSVSGNTLYLDTTDDPNDSPNRPMSSHGVYHQLDLADTIMAGI